MIAERAQLFGRSGMEERRAQRIAIRERAEAKALAELQNEWRQTSLLACPTPHKWREFKLSRNGSPLCPNCGYTRAELGLDKTLKPVARARQAKILTRARA